MATIHVLKTATGALIPANDESIEAIKRFRVGNVVKVEVTQMRNGAFFRKWWALAKIAFDMWTETAQMPKHKGVAIEPTFDRFRHDLTIQAGYYKVVVNINLETRLEADSLAWGSMDEETFEKLYSNTINVVLNKVLAGRGLDDKTLRNMVDQVMEFAG